MLANTGTKYGYGMGTYFEDHFPNRQTFSQANTSLHADRLDPSCLKQYLTRYQPPTSAQDTQRHSNGLFGFVDPMWVLQHPPQHLMILMTVSKCQVLLFPVPERWCHRGIKTDCRCLRPCWPSDGRYHVPRSFGPDIRTTHLAWSATWEKHTFQHPAGL